MCPPGFLLPDSPSDVLAHECRRIVAARAECTQRGWIRRRIAEPDREIAQPALVADAPDCAALEPLIELLLAPGEQLDQRSPIEAVAHSEIVDAGHLREAIPRAHELAVVAAVDAITEQRPQRLGNAALMLDGQIRDAAARIQSV